jgi:branched-chain amino acid transport system permease protein
VSGREESPHLALATAPLLLLPAALLLAGAPLGWSLTSFALALILLVAGLHLIAGLGGMPFLAHAALAGIGAIVSGEVAAAFAPPAPALLAIGAMAAAALAALAAPILRRLGGLALCAASLVLSELLAQLVDPSGREPPFEAEVIDVALYLAAAGAALLALLLAQRIGASAFGQAVRVAQDHPELAASAGFDLARARGRLLVLGAAAAGAAGALLATAPSGPYLEGAFGTGASLVLLALIVIGRPGSLAGALAASLPVVLLPALILGLIPGLIDLRLPVAGLGVLLTLLLRAELPPPPAALPPAVTPADAREPGRARG